MSLTGLVVLASYLVLPADATRYQCFSNEWAQRQCCSPVYGPAGLDLCWNERANHRRCCLQGGGYYMKDPRTMDLSIGQKMKDAGTPIDDFDDPLPLLIVEMEPPMEERRFPNGCKSDMQWIVDMLTIILTAGMTYDRIGNANERSDMLTTGHISSSTLAVEKLIRGRVWYDLNHFWRSSWHYLLSGELRFGLIHEMEDLMRSYGDLIGQCPDVALFVGLMKVQQLKSIHGDLAQEIYEQMWRLSRAMLIDGMIKTDPFDWGFLAPLNSQNFLNRTGAVPTLPSGSVGHKRISASEHTISTSRVTSIAVTQKSSIGLGSMGSVDRLLRSSNEEVQGDQLTKLRRVFGFGNGIKDEEVLEKLSRSLETLISNNYIAFSKSVYPMLVDFFSSEHDKRWSTISKEPDPLPIIDYDGSTAKILSVPPKEGDVPVEKIIIRVKGDPARPTKTVLENPQDWTSVCDAGPCVFKDGIEWPEHIMVQNWVPPGAKILELGGRFGTTVCEIAKALSGSTNPRVVSVEPNPAFSRDILPQNLMINNCASYIVPGVVGDDHVEIGVGIGRYFSRTRPLNHTSIAEEASVAPNKTQVVPAFTIQEIEKTVGFKFDSLLIDCEGCIEDLLPMLEPLTNENKVENPQIGLILLETDMGIDGEDCQERCVDYGKITKLFSAWGLEIVHEFNDCDVRQLGESNNGNFRFWHACVSWIAHVAYKRRQPNDTGAAAKTEATSPRTKGEMILRAEGKLIGDPRNPSYANAAATADLQKYAEAGSWLPKISYNVDVPNAVDQSNKPVAATLKKRRELENLEKGDNVISVYRGIQTLLPKHEPLSANKTLLTLWDGRFHLVPDAPTIDIVVPFCCEPEGGFSHLPSKARLFLYDICGCGLKMFKKHLYQKFLSVDNEETDLIILGDEIPKAKRILETLNAMKGALERKKSSEQAIVDGLSANLEGNIAKEFTETKTAEKHDEKTNSQRKVFKKIIFDASFVEEVPSGEIVAYFYHMWKHYSDLADVTLFLHPDHQEHVRRMFLDRVLASVKNKGTWDFNIDFINLGWRHETPVIDGKVGPHFSYHCQWSDPVTGRPRLPCRIDEHALPYGITRRFYATVGDYNPHLLQHIWDTLFQEEIDARVDDFGSYDFNQLLISRRAIRDGKSRSYYKFLAWKLQSMESYTFLDSNRKSWLNMRPVDQSAEVGRRRGNFIGEMAENHALWRKRIWKQRYGRRMGKSKAVVRLASILNDQDDLTEQQNRLLKPRTGVPFLPIRSVAHFVSHRLDLSSIWDFNKSVCIWFEHLWHLLFGPHEVRHRPKAERKHVATIIKNTIEEYENGTLIEASFFADGSLTPQLRSNRVRVQKPWSELNYAPLYLGNFANNPIELEKRRYLQSTRMDDKDLPLGFRDFLDHHQMSKYIMTPDEVCRLMGRCKDNRTSTGWIPY